MFFYVLYFVSHLYKILVLETLNIRFIYDTFFAKYAVLLFSTLWNLTSIKYEKQSYKAGKILPLYIPKD